MPTAPYWPALLDALKQSGGMTAPAILVYARRLGVSAVAVRRQVDRAAAAGVLEKRGTGLPGRQLGCCVYVVRGAGGSSGAAA